MFRRYRAVPVGLTPEESEEWELWLHKARAKADRIKVLHEITGQWIGLQDDRWGPDHMRQWQLEHDWS